MTKMTATPPAPTAVAAPAKARPALKAKAKTKTDARVKAPGQPQAAAPVAAKPARQPNAAAPKVRPAPPQVVKASKASKAPKAPQADGVAAAAAPKAVRAAEADAAAKAHAKPRAKLVRDSFTMPQQDFALIDTLKERALGFKRPTKKSELLRAGLQVLAGLTPDELKQVLGRLVPLKTGRPKKAG